MCGTAGCGGGGGGCNAQPMLQQALLSLEDAIAAPMGQSDATFPFSGKLSFHQINAKIKELKETQVRSSSPF